MKIKEVFKNYDDVLLETLNIEIRINNWEKATFKDINEAEHYINTIVHNSYRWFVAGNNTVVFDFYLD